MSISDLPPDILSKIFKYLHPHEWFYSEFVCKTWSAILREFWDHVKEVEYESYGYVRVTFTDQRSWRLTCSGGEWTDDNDLLAVVLKRCGARIQKLILHVPQDITMTLHPETVLAIGIFCKELKALSLNGHVSSMADTISVICHDLLDLEEMFIWDESFPDETGNSEITAGILVGDIISTCTRLRSLDVNFLFIPPPSEDACRRLANLENIERIRWLFWSPLSPEYVETFFSSVIGCRRTLNELSFTCKLKAPLDGAKCGGYLTRLAEESDNGLEILDLGFQLHEAVYEEGSNEVYYDPVESAPWTNELLPSLHSFHKINNLSLRYFDLDNDAALEALKPICGNLQIFRLEDSFGVNGKLTWTLRAYLTNLRAISISQARLSHADMVEFILECPNLETLRFSNVESMSFKRLVLETHAALHHCGQVSSQRKKVDGANVQSLNLRLDTARGYIHDEAEELKTVHLCGLTLLPPSHSNVIIERVCKMANG